MEENKKVHPIFYRRIPKNAAYFFNPASDDEFKAAHPYGYYVLVACGITAFMLPLLLYAIFTGIYSTPNSGWLFLGIFGAFIIGIGLFNIVAAWIGQYLGHLVTSLCIGVGALMVGASLLLMYNKTLVELFDQEMVNYYFTNLVMLCVPALYYPFFRMGVNHWLRTRGIGKSVIRKSKKGKKNFWWYEELHEQYGLGPLYHINRLFTVVYPCVYLLHFLLGWIKIVSILVFVLLTLTCLMASAMSLFSSIQSNKEVYGRPFIIVRRSENGGIDSVIIDLFAAAVPLFLVYAELIAVAGLWKLPWHLTIG